MSLDTEASLEDPERTAAAEPRHAAENDPVAGTTIGRYVVVEVAGRGAMGRVLRAYDPKLRREVALKVVHAGRSDGEQRAGARLLREAHALARLSHPNVVAVYDAEATDDGVAIAMEYVEGRTLRVWLGERRRTWPEVVAIGSAIAAGLAAAHGAGLVHRDVKPDNVLVGNDDRVRVTDFGLARELDAAWVRPSGSPAYELDGSDATLTEAGAVLGTPAYMAPEQHEGTAADARADQYALCVVLFEALHGARPFAGASASMLATAKRAGPPSRPPTPIPMWLHAVVSRGLAPDPDRRWPSLEAFSRALRAGRKRARRRWLLVPAVVVPALALAWVEVRDANARAAVSACDAAGASIEEVWNDDTRNAVREALLGSGIGYAALTADRVAPWLDAHARTWQQTREGVCMDATVHERDGWDLDVLDRAAWCLDERRMELSALIDQLLRADPATVTRAVQVAASLDQIEPCRDRELLTRLPPPPTANRDEVQATRAEISRARVLQATGDYDTGLSVARAALERAEKLEWPPLTVAARFQVGWMLQAIGEYAEAEAVLEQTYFEAALAGVAEGAADAADGLVYLVGGSLVRPAEGLRWSQHAEVWIAELPESSRLREAWVLGGRGSIEHDQGAYAEARAHHEQAIAIFERVLGPMHPQVAGSLSNAARAATALGAFDDAEAMDKRAIAIFERQLGPEHPHVAKAIVNLGTLHLARGEYEEAAALYRRALVVLERELAPDHPHIGSTLADLGNAYQRLGLYPEALEALERALEINERALGPEHPGVAIALHNLAIAYAEAKSFERAEASFERAIAIKTNALGPEHPSLALTIGALGNLHYDAGSHHKARALLERAIAIDEKALGKDHPALVFLITAAARVALAQHRNADAVALASRSVALTEAGSSSPLDIAGARWVLAQAITDDSERARRLAEGALEAYREAGPGYLEQVAEVEAWLARAYGSVASGHSPDASR